MERLSPILSNRRSEPIDTVTPASHNVTMSRQRHTIFFSTQPLGEAVWHPAADVYRTPDGWLLKFDLAGVDPEDVAVSVQGRRVTVRGMRRDSQLDQGCSYYRMEISYSQFERSVDLPCVVENARWQIDFRNGMLLVKLQGGALHDR
jgi:HSP20 family protein